MQLNIKSTVKILDVNIFADAANKVARDSSLHVETQKQTLLSMIFPTGAHHLLYKHMSPKL
jgi:hypothetical protein